MQFNNIHIIVNPAAGKEEPILSYLNTGLIITGIRWDVTVTTPYNEAYDIAMGLVGKTDLIVVYGGDGSVSDVARALYGKQTPMAIIPGGTANVMSKELGIPQDAVEAIELLASGKLKLMKMDMGLANGRPFLLRVNLGILADMILHADRELKDSYGQLAYGITAIQTVAAAEPMYFRMLIDGQPITEAGVTLTITNAGNIGISDFTFLPDIRTSDGYLDVILMNNTDMLSLIRVAGATLFQTESEVLKHWRCKEMVVMLNKRFKYICDDSECEADTITIKVIPQALKILVPDTYLNYQDNV